MFPRSANVLHILRAKFYFEVAKIGIRNGLKSRHVCVYKRKEEWVVGILIYINYMCSIIKRRAVSNYNEWQLMKQFKCIYGVLRNIDIRRNVISYKCKYTLVYQCIWMDTRRVLQDNHRLIKIAVFSNLLTDQLGGASESEYKLGHLKEFYPRTRLKNNLYWLKIFVHYSIVFVYHICIVSFIVKV